MSRELTVARNIAVWLFIVGIYIGAPLKIGSAPIPAFLAGLAGLFLLRANASQIKKQHVLLLLGLGALTMIGIVANSGDGAEISRVKGAVQLLYSVTIAYGLFIELRSWEKERVMNLFYTISILIVVGCFLEVYTSFKELSDGFRNYVFEKKGLYNSNFRDMLVFGKVRPKLFSVEPSYVSIFFLLSMTMWYTLSKDTRARSDKYFLLAMAGMFLIGSPIVILVVLIPMLNFLFLNEKSQNPFKAMVQGGSAKKLFFVLMYSFALFLTMLAIWRGVGIYAEGNPILTDEGSVFAEDGSELAEGRLSQIINGKEDSFSGRLVAPPMIAYQVLQTSPWFGVGLEAHEKLNNVVLMVFKQIGMQTGHVETSTLGKSITNVFWLHWIYFGLFGGWLMVFWVYKSMKAIGVVYPLFCFLVICMFMQTMGGYVTPRFWFISFLIMLLGTLQGKSKDDIETAEYADDAQK